MRSKFSAYFMLLSVVIMFASCLKDKDENITYRGDSAITAFSVVTAKRYAHTISKSGADSVYRANVSCSNYKFYIDQIACEIYNPDSLPKGVDLKKLICSITSRNSGTILINLSSVSNHDTLKVYSSTDSLDFSMPREVRVYNEQSTSYRTYTVRVNVHQQDGDAMTWKQEKNGELNFMKASQIRLAAVGNNVYGFGLSQEDGSTWMMDLKKRVASGGTDENSLSTLHFGFVAIDNVVSYGNRLAVYDEEGLHSLTLTDDGTEQWTHTKAIYGEDKKEINLKQLVGMSDKEMYAIGTDGKLLVSTDNGLTWAEEQLDKDVSFLPDNQISCTVHDVKTNEGMERVELSGYNEEEGKFVFWTKIVDKAEPGAQSVWLFNGGGYDKSFWLPSADNMRIFAYGDGNIAIGCSSSGAFAQIYVSNDGCITWQKSTTYSYPSEILCSGVFDAAADDDGYIWLVCGGSGQIWRGMLNRYGWEVVQKSFTE